VDDIANLSTPHYRPRDLDTKAFQQALGEAIDRRRRQTQPLDGPLDVPDTWQLEFEQDGIDVRPRPVDEGILFHDRNNRDVERTMQRLAENTMTHNMALDFVRSEYDLLRLAIRERA
jgi:flagellar basal-body rod protein FlgB